MTAKPETLSSLQSKIEHDGNAFTVPKALYAATVHVRIKSLLMHFQFWKRLIVSQNGPSRNSLLN